MSLIIQLADFCARAPDRCQDGMKMLHTKSMQLSGEVSAVLSQHLGRPYSPDQLEALAYLLAESDSEAEQALGRALLHTLEKNKPDAT